MMAEMRMDDVAMRDRENERKIVTSLYANQTHLNFINNNKEVHLQSKKEKALKRAQYVDEQNERQREEEENSVDDRACQEQHPVPHFIVEFGGDLEKDATVVEEIARCMNL